MSALKLIASDSFLCINKNIAKAFGLDAAVLLAELASCYNYVEAQGGLTEDNMFFETVERIEENTTLTKYQQSKAVTVLEEAGVLYTEKRGLPAKRYFGINEEKLLEVVDHKKSKNLTTGSEKTEPQDSQFFDPNNNRVNKNRESKNRDNKESGQAGQTTTPVKPKKWTLEDTLNVVEESTMSDPLKEQVSEWIHYKHEEKKFKYGERSSKSLVRSVEKAEQKYGSVKVINQIDRAINSGWQGMNLNLIESGGGNNKQQRVDPLVQAMQEMREDGEL